MPAILIMLGGCALHAVLCDIAPVWWVPDVTLLVLIILTAAQPSRWLAFAAVAGLATMCWSASPVFVLGWNLALGAGMSFLATTWDLTDSRIQLTVVGVAESAWLLAHVWVQDIPLWPLLPLMAAHVLVTLGAAPVVRWALNRQAIGEAA